MTGQKIKVLLLLLPLLAVGCALVDDNGPKKSSRTGLIVTPPSYYSTTKARYLGGKYQENLDRLVERIVRNPKTSTLQFANNISSVGGIGFFTHSAAKTPDERYLEVVLGTPETFENKGDLSDKVHHLFSLYGVEILGILSGDNDINQDKELSGYGLNLAWRNFLAEPAGNRVTMARAIIYLSKDRVRSFLRQELNQNNLLGNAVIFSVEENGPLTLVSYRPQEMRPDFRPAIREDNLASTPFAPKITPAQPSQSQSNEPSQNVEQPKKEPSNIKEATSSTNAKASRAEAKAELKTTVAAAEKNPEIAAKTAGKTTDSQEKAKSPQRDGAQDAEITRRETSVSGVPAHETKREPNVFSPKPGRPQTQQVAPPLTAESPAEKKLPVAQSTDPAPREENDRLSKKTEEIRPGTSIPEAPKTDIEMKKNDAVKRVVEAPKPAPAVTTEKPVVEPKKPDAGTNEKLSEPVVAKSSVEKSAVGPRNDAKKNIEPPSIASEVETPVRRVAPAHGIAPPALTDKAPEGLIPERTKTATGVVKSAEPSRPPDAKPPTPLAPLSTPKLEAQPQQAKPSLPSAKTTLEEKNVGTPTPASVQIAKAADENKTSETKIAEKLTPPTAAAKHSAVEAMKSAHASDVTKIETPASAPRIESAPATAKLPEVKDSSVRAAPPEPAGKSKADSTRSGEVEKPHPGASGVAKVETPVIETQPSTVTTASSRETVKDKSAGEQIALLKKPTEVVPEKKPLGRTIPKLLEGFIIQLGFNDREKAQRWAETMERRGYAVSITEAGAEGALRVRLGNFAIREDAERQLQTFKQQGLSGIIINLPQGFRPEARSSIP